MPRTCAVSCSDWRSSRFGTDGEGAADREIAAGRPRCLRGVVGGLWPDRDRPAAMSQLRRAGCRVGGGEPVAFSRWHSAGGTQPVALNRISPHAKKPSGRPGWDLLGPVSRCRPGGRGRARIGGKQGGGSDEVGWDGMDRVGSVRPVGGARSRGISRGVPGRDWLPANADRRFCGSAFPATRGCRSPA